jgi:hypothetical protein
MTFIKRFAVPALVLAALAGLAIWGALQKTRPDKVQPIPCINPVSGCTFVHHGMPARISFSSTPETMKPFVITLSHPTLRQASASFQMVGMNMGFNRYDLKRGPDGNWTARIVLPVCTDSRADWIAELKLDEQFYSLSFATR